MGLFEYQERLERLVKKRFGKDFIYEFLKAYDIPNSTVKLSELRNRRASLIKKGIVIVPRRLTFRLIHHKGVHQALEELKNDPEIKKTNPKFIIVSDGHKFEAIDRDTWKTLDINVSELPKKAEFFLPLTKKEKYVATEENTADVKAAYKMARLYDELLKTNPSLAEKKYNNKKFNVFFSRLLFCYFAEDTGLFTQKKGLFTNYISSYTQENGSDLDDYLNRVFEILNTPPSDTLRSNAPDYLAKFDYVNGGLFGDKYYAPKFTATSRKLLIEVGTLQWKDINPDIFGSMIQAVVHPDQRSGMGMHYTSVPNIMKVIEPLFLNELREDFSENSDNPQKLKKLLERIYKLRIFDPACGSGNFLIISYKELRRLEMDIFTQLQRISKEWAGEKSTIMSGIRLSQFYGIELDDFAHEVAILSLWLAEHQMNVKFKQLFGSTPPSLPLREGGNIVCANATRIPWEDVCPKAKDAEIYILGNPPYVGSRKQDEVQKIDLKFLFEADYGSLDYISAWFFKGARYILDANAKCAFVSTNSICQGEQAALTWSKILDDKIEIGFAYTGFKWQNNAKSNAAVIVIIVCLQNKQNNNHYLYVNGVKSLVKSINPYLTEGKTIYIHSRNKPISRLPEMNFGNMPADGGKLLLNTDEKNQSINSDSRTKKWIKKLISAHEFLNGQERWCFWLQDISEEEIDEIPTIHTRVEELKDIRLNSSRPQLANIPHLFAQITQPPNKNFILIPRHSSENREYIPIGYFDSENIAHDSCLIVPTDEVYIFGILTSKIHMSWVKAVSGRIKTDFRYSKDIVYNNFPVPELTQFQKDSISENTLNVFQEREAFSERTLAELYNPDKMPAGLREAHHNLDLAVERCYRSKPFTSDEERLEYLFKLYEEMTAKEQLEKKHA